jgi:AcrR family transcriptional regulator
MPRVKARRSGVQLGEPVVRAMVMSAAVKLFVHHGYRAVSVEDILAAAKISRRTFYKVFDGKDAVGVAMYRAATDGLVDEWRKSLTQGSDLITRLLACMDVQLRNAATVGRLMYVLNGEATTPDSPLLPIRMAVQDRLLELLFTTVRDHDRSIDPLFVRTLALASESLVFCLLAEGDEGRRVTEAQIKRARRVMARIVTASLNGEGPQVTEFPTA